MYSIMAKKCGICGEELETTFLDKLDGTIVRTGKGENLETHYVCPSCQKEYGEDLRKKLL